MLAVMPAIGLLLGAGSLMGNLLAACRAIAVAIVRIAVVVRPPVDRRGKGVAEQEYAVTQVGSGA